MKRKHKMTGCARFFIAILIIAPLAYIGASYYNHQDPIQNIKNFFGSSNAKHDDTYGADENTRDARDREIKKLRDENANLKKENDLLKKELEQLKEGSQ